MPRVLLEASAVGRPMIATNVPGCNAVVQHEVNGLLCDAGDSAQLAAAIKTFSNIPNNQRALMGLRAREGAESKFSINNVNAKYLYHLEQLGTA